MMGWSELPEELLGKIAIRLFSVVELKCFRSICTSWRSSTADYSNHPFKSRPLISLKPLIATDTNRSAFLSRASFFRVTLSSSPDKGWLIKSDKDLNSGKFCLLEPLSRFMLKHSKQSIDLMEYSVSEIREAFVIHSPLKTSGCKRLVLVNVAGGGDPRVFGVGFDGKIRYWEGKIWKIIKNQMAYFSDITVHKGLTYALDSEGKVWWISSSLEIFLFGPRIEDSCDRDDKSFVECCGELYIVDRLLEENLLERKANTSFSGYSYTTNDDTIHVKFELLSDRHCSKTVGFKVYKMDMESLGKLVEVSTLGDKAIVMATDSCFSVLAHEYYGCLPNTIYFTDNEKEIKVFKLGSITTMALDCCEMFVPSFLYKLV